MSTPANVVVDFVRRPIGVVWNGITDAERDAGVTVVNNSIPSHEQIGFIIPNRYGDNENPGTTDMTPAFNAARDVAIQNGGGQIRPLLEDYGLNNFELATGVWIVGPNIGESLPTDDNGPRLIGLAAGAVIKTPGTTQVINCGVQGVTIIGLGAGISCIGVHFDNVFYSTVRYCSFYNLADQAIKADADTVICLFQSNVATACLANHTRSAKEGVLDLDGAGHRIMQGEYTISGTGLTSVNARCGAIVLRGGEHFVDGVIGEISDFGLATIGVTGPIRMVNARCDLNFGNGFEISDSTQLTNCESTRNGQAASGTYDGFVISGGNNSFAQCLAYSLVADGWFHRYGFNDAQSANANKNLYDALCRSVGHTTKSFNLQTFAGGSRQFMRGSPLVFTAADTTPSVADYGAFRTGGAVTITDLDDGQPGQEVVIYIQDAVTFDCTGTNLKAAGGVDITAVSGDLVIARTIDGTTWRLQHVDCT